MRLSSLTLIAVCLAAAVGVGRARMPNADLRQQVIDHERAFAATMAQRDIDGFSRYVAREAVFMSGTESLRGREAVMNGWRRYFDGPRAPFAWEPEQVEVLASGTLAYSTGPVRDAAGRRIGSFNSVWRLEAPGRWTIVFDRGCDCRALSQANMRPAALAPREPEIPGRTPG